MAAPDTPRPATDADLASIQQARALARKARQAQSTLAELSQAQIDAIVDAMAAGVRPHIEELARLAVEETTFGVVADKVEKNLFSCERVYEFIRPMATVGVVNRLPDRKIIEIAEPFGVVAAIVPSTNPTSTAIYKILIALKARCAIVISPHPSAARCITRVAEIMGAAARAAGAPEGAINWMTGVTLEGTQELMKQREVAVILATGGMGLVRAAYSAGKPAYGVGPGNAPCYIESSADVRKAASDILIGKSFDNGVLCSSPNSVVVDAAIADAAMREFQAQGAYFLSPTEADALARVLVTPQRLPNPALVGKSAAIVAEKAGFTVLPGTRALIAPLAGVGRDYPLSIEKLCPVLSYYVVEDWREGCARCIEILRYGGMGHTMSIHSQNDEIILEFGLRKPAFRICVNTPTTHGSIGLTTGLDPAMTLGCGGWGGNITSDNISPRHLLNIKRLAYEVRPAVDNRAAVAVPVQAAARGLRGPARPRPEPVSADVLARRIDAFLAARGIAPDRVTPDGPVGGPAARPADAGAKRSAPESGAQPDRAASAPADRGLVAPPVITGAAASGPAAVELPVAEFVCEDDVRAAVKAGRRIRLGPKTIVTPAAREAGETHRIFDEPPWHV
jgi:acetaldehyde dehydrogenase (acetylating)